jgi:hypothetical protein
MATTALRALAANDADPTASYRSRRKSHDRRTEMDETTRIIAATLAAACVQPQSTFDIRTAELAVEYFQAILIVLQNRPQGSPSPP